MKKSLFALIFIAMVLSSCNMFPNNSQDSLNNSNTNISNSSDSTNSGDSSTSLIPPSTKPLDIYVIEMTAGCYGDSTLLQIVNNDRSSYDILIDCGWQVDGTFVHNFLSSKMMDKTIDLFIGTHPHADHVGGFKNMLGDDLNIKTIIDWGTNELYSYYSVRNKLVNNGTKFIKYYEAINSSNKSDQEYVLNNDTNFKLNLLNTGVWDASGNCSVTDNINGDSVAALFTYHNFTYLTMGDSIGINDTNIMKNNNDILPSDGVTLYKASHHGSYSNDSNSVTFLNRINPKAIAISASRVAGENGYTNASKGLAFDDTQNKTCTVDDQPHPSEIVVSRYLNLPNIKNTKNVYWNMYAGTMLFQTYGIDEAPIMQGEGATVGYYANESDTVKVSGENNKKYVDTIVYKNRH
jgi:beta-lactamase superfamily II metal-dependent hydrolase